MCTAGCRDEKKSPSPHWGERHSSRGSTQLPTHDTTAMHRSTAPITGRPGLHTVARQLARSGASSQGVFAAFRSRGVSIGAPQSLSPSARLLVLIAAYSRLGWWQTIPHSALTRKQTEDEGIEQGAAGPWYDAEPKPRERTVGGSCRNTTTADGLHEVQACRASR